MFNDKKDFVLIGKSGTTDCCLKTFPVFPNPFGTINRCFLEGGILTGNII